MKRQGWEPGWHQVDDTPASVAEAGRPDSPPTGTDCDRFGHCWADGRGCAYPEHDAHRKCCDCGYRLVVGVQDRIGSKAVGEATWDEVIHRVVRALLSLSAERRMELMGMRRVDGMTEMEILMGDGRLWTDAAEGEV